MPLNSLQQYALGILNGLPIPGSSQRLDAYLTPPAVDDLDNPKAYLWGGRLIGNRQTMPRGAAPAAGFKKLTWVVDVYLSYETTPDSPTVDQEFAVIIDAVMNAFWTTTMPTFIVDEVTGVKSQILSIGENFELEYPPERMPATLRMLYYTARLGWTVTETVQG